MTDYPNRITVTFLGRSVELERAKTRLIRYEGWLDEAFTQYLEVRLFRPDEWNASYAGVNGYGDSRDASLAELEKALVPVAGVLAPLLNRDACQRCHGKRGGVRGNENIVNGVTLCDYCHADDLEADDADS